MKDQPLSSNELSKIVIFVLLSIPSIVFLVGIIPALFLFFGVFMMKKSGDFSHVETAVRNYNYYVSVPLVLLVVLALYNMSNLSPESSYRYDNEISQIIICLVFVGVCILYIFFASKLFLSPLAAHSEWVVNNGIFSGKRKNSNATDDNSNINIIKGERLRSFSVADELIKWAKLKEDGHITEQEFNDARKKLLQRN